MESERSLATPKSTRDALLDAALDGFSRNGFEGTSIRDLARAVGIRESSVYKHFSSKQAIFDALIELADSRLSDVGARMGVQISKGSEAAEAYKNVTEEHVTGIAHRMFEFVLHDPVFSKLRRLMMIEQYRDPEVAARLGDYLITRPLKFQTELFGELLSGMKSAEPSSPTQAALAFFGPIFMLIQMAESDEAQAKALLTEHIKGFRRTHLGVTQ